MVAHMLRPKPALLVPPTSTTDLSARTSSAWLGSALKWRLFSRPSPPPRSSSDHARFAEMASAIVKHDLNKTEDFIVGSFYSLIRLFDRLPEDAARGFLADCGDTLKHGEPRRLLV